MLSPTLFNIVISQCLNDLESQCKDICFADDVCIYFRHNNINTLKSELEKSIEIIGRKLANLDLQLAPEKTNLVIFTKKQISLDNHYITYNNTNIQAKATAKYLGITLDYRLEWRKQLEVMVTNVRKRIDILKFMRSTWEGGHPKTLMLFYKSYVRGYMDYCSIYLKDDSNKHMKKLEILQRRAMRFTMGYRNSVPNGNVYAETKMPPLTKRFQKTAIKFAVNLASYEKNPVYSAIRKFYYSTQLNNRYNYSNNLFLISGFRFLTRHNVNEHIMKKNLPFEYWYDRNKLISPTINHTPKK